MATESRSYAYQRIAEDLRQRVASGEFGGGHVLPSEADLATSYAASRLTVRRALGILRDEGLVDARRGFGWFVAAHPLEHTLGNLGTIEEQISRSGKKAERNVLTFEFGVARGRVAEVLGVPRVLHVGRINTAGGETVARVDAHVPEGIAGGLSLAEVQERSLYELLPVDIGSATQRISAVAASEEDAELLGVPVGSPCLQSERITLTVDGDPALYAIAIFPGHRVEYVVELPRAPSPTGAEGMRLAENGDGDTDD
jgi:GntR family transcriptional regulator